MLFGMPLVLAGTMLFAGNINQDGSDLERLKKRVDELEKKIQESGDKPWIYEQSKEGKFPLYSKPFLARFGRTTYLGGYMDLEYTDKQGAVSTFDNHRLIPFLYSDISERVKFATEIEYEHSGSEVKLEFGFIDFLLFKPTPKSDGIEFSLNLRSGLILDPLGKLNLYHDSPIQDLTERPLVDRVIVPTTLSEPGVGLWGAIDTGSSRIDYELYVVNGFKGLDQSGATVLFNKTNGLRDGRGSSSKIGSAYRDNNTNKSLVGRVGVMPVLGIDTGLSAHIGKYDSNEDNTLAIYVFDLGLHMGGVGDLFGIKSPLLHKFKITGEYVYADLERDAFAKSKKVPSDMNGYYAQLNYLFFPDFLRSMMGSLAKDESTFTLIYRLGQVDLDGNGTKRQEFGINYRVDKYSVIKLEYQHNQEFKDLPDSSNNAWLVSFATYF
ncbi:MAG: hypothetical protein HY606_08250 [Planctomycetes bacterium]|nr:hypothetical protein [Planctomycetota bacterium]